MMKATKQNVINWLKKYYGVKDADAVQLVEDHPEVINEARDYDSAAYYAADKIAGKEGLQELENPIDMEIGEDD